MRKFPGSSCDRFADRTRSVTHSTGCLGAACLAPSRTAVCATILTAATLAIAPYLLRGYTLGHDIELHASWWLDISALWRQGILYPRWSELAYYGYGEPTFLFYPPLSLYLGGLLTSLLPFRLVPGVYVWLVLGLAGFSFFHLCRQFLDARYALLGAVVYVMNPYHLLEVHARYSFAELLISALLPLLLLAIYRLDEPGGHRIAIAALLFAVISLTNMPGAVVGSYSGFAFVIAMMMARKSGAGLAAKFAHGCGSRAPDWRHSTCSHHGIEQRWVLASIHPMSPPEDQFVRLTSLPTNRFLWALAGVEAAQIVIGVPGLGAMPENEAAGCVVGVHRSVLGLGRHGAPHFGCDLAFRPVSALRSVSVAMARSHGAGHVFFRRRRGPAVKERTYCWRLPSALFASS